MAKAHWWKWKVFVHELGEMTPTKYRSWWPLLLEGATFQESFCFSKLVVQHMFFHLGVCGVLVVLYMLTIAYLQYNKFHVLAARTV